mmetsp:Transcript_5523/g.20760  ORF Transcript_5523/g.20760 Transcript_5523/m.20760 type:complete len:1827 (-) Transcript_5523:1768-7248(-)|eukprot:CAMPEP_0117444714 /NCGR_PEP_ID=MMETSP0759-20121206/5393_1 /TAXON_ID=63605 /ORGANISM="Percolomonas cosmopolitus, Strain WS" /LENGTH=1826 /DNA_ID=CAMNT_0005236809 /DNA_START=223 /DNA_END=5703 /DNA_ORIENTATION=+
MVHSNLKSLLSSYNASQLHSAGPHTYAHITGRGIHFHNTQNGTSRVFWPERWLGESQQLNTSRRTPLGDTTNDASDHHGSSLHENVTARKSISKDSVTSTRDLFRSSKSTSTPNTSVTSHDSGAHQIDSAGGNVAAAAPGGNTAGSGASYTGTSHQHASLSIPPHRSGAAGPGIGASNAAAAAAHSLRKANHIAYNPFQRLGKQLNPAGTNAIAFSISQNIFAIAEKKLNPSIHIYDTESFEHLMTLSNATKIEFKCLSFSRDGKFLVALGSLPDFSICVWNVETGELMCTAAASSQTISVSFDPRDSTQLCSSGANGHLVFWTLSAGTLRSIEPQLIAADLLDNTQVLCHTWGRNSDIFVGAEDGDIFHFSSIHAPGDIMSPDQIEGTESIRAMTVSKYHLITGSDDGILRFYSLDTKEFCRQIQVAASEGQVMEEEQDDSTESNPHKVRLSPTSSVSSDIASLVLNPPYDTLIVGSADGSLYQVHLENYSDRSTVVNDIRLHSMRISSKLLVESHCGSVNGMCLVGNSEQKLLATAGEDGSVRLWNYSQGTMRTKLQFNVSFTSLKSVNNLLFLGSSMGYLRVIDISSFLVSSVETPEIIYCARLRRFSVEQLDVDSVGNCVVRFSDNYIAVLTVHKPDEEDEHPAPLQVTHSSMYALHFAGFIKSDTRLTCIRMTNQNSFFVANDECGLMLFKIPSKAQYGSAPDYLINTDVFNQKKWKLDYPVLDLTLLASAKGKLEIITLSLDKSIKHYDLGSSGSVSTLNPIQEVESHLKANYASVALSSDFQYVASGTDDGILWVRNVKAGLEQDTASDNSTFTYRHNAMEGGIKSVCFGSSDNPLLIFSCGGDGAVFVSEVSAHGSLSNPHENSSSDLISHPEPAQDESTLYLPSDAYGADSEEQPLITQLSDEEQSYSQSLSVAERERTEKVLAQMREEFDRLHHENEEVPDDEKLPASEFILDEEYVATIEKHHDEQVKILRERIKNDNLKKELLTQRIIDECFTKMEKHNENINGLYETQLCVTNYSLPKIDSNKTKLLQKMNFMRSVEEVDLKSRRKVAITRDLEGGFADEAAQQGENGANGESARVRADTNQDDDEQGFDDEHIFHKYVMSEYDIKNRTPIDIPQPDETGAILYNKFDLYTRQRKVTQMWLLHGQIQQLKRNFNTTFKDVQDLKVTVLNKIDRVNSHIVDIVDDLEYDPNEYIYNVEKVNNNILEVKDEEVDAEKWVDPEENARREEEELRKRAALENSKEGVIIERALQMMMDGRLEDKSKKKAGVDEIPKPACLEKPAEELTDQEKKQIVEYEKAVKELEEEETKKRKQQEAKLKNAQNDIADTCNVFDQKLKSLFASKLQCDRTIFELELAIIKLAQSILDHEDNLTKQRQHKEVETQLEQQNTEYVHTVQQFEKTVHEYTKLCDDSVRTIADMERSFKENMLAFMKHYQQQHPSDYSTKEMQDVVDRLSRIFPKSKSLKLKIPTRQEFMHRTQSDSDPFADISAEKEWMPPALTQPVKRPENATDWLWEKFLELRKEKILLEYSYLMRMHDLEKRRDEEQRLRDYTRQLEEIISRQIKERNKFNEKVLREQYNLDYLFNFKQGQIEVEQQAVVTDYGDAALISKQNIIDLNRQIMQNARQNIDQMRKIMDLSKKIEQINWENEALLFEADDKDDVYQRFQRLRVTKEMQNVLKTGHNNQELQERDRDRLVEQIEHTKQNRTQRIKEKKKIVLKIAKNVDRTSKENTTLTTQLDQLQRIVKERKMIHDLQSTTAAKERQNQKMKQLRMERKLKDLSQAQTTELDYLRETIQVLRQRTFPSFALVKKSGGI